MARFFEAGDYYDSYRGRRHCAAPPRTSALVIYQPHSQARRPGRTGAVAGEASRRGESAVWCVLPLAAAQRGAIWLRDLATLIIARGANVNVGTEPRGETPLPGRTIWPGVGRGRPCGRRRWRERAPRSSDGRRCTRRHPGWPAHLTWTARVGGRESCLSHEERTSAPVSAEPDSHRSTRWQLGARTSG